MTNQPPTDDELTAIRARAEAATDGLLVVEHDTGGEWKVFGPQSAGLTPAFDAAALNTLRLAHHFTSSSKIPLSMPPALRQLPGSLGGKGLLISCLNKSRHSSAEPTTPPTSHSASHA